MFRQTPETHRASRSWSGAGRAPDEHVLRFALEYAVPSTKPHNIIFVTKLGHAKIPDFGLVKRVSGDEALSQMPTADETALLTRPGSTVGTIAYMSKNRFIQRSPTNDF